MGFLFLSLTITPPHKYTVVAQSSPLLHQQNRFSYCNRLSLLLHKPFYVQLRSNRLQQSILEPVRKQCISQAEIDASINIANAADHVGFGMIEGFTLNFYFPSYGESS
ncbi:hypothetical protein MKW98_009145 [Papaver atlanticum]|uniref:Uncharacterized protein n=1 Tax=Papaver atlanticum TaxID=357466 RepID=A0AAD4XSZ5_9MAGN|nr:hypothetical protein MKW98_009145 [Papaver atlanticum]